jgi:hypothetical protein
LTHGASLRTTRKPIRDDGTYYQKEPVRGKKKLTMDLKNLRRQVFHQKSLPIFSGESECAVAGDSRRKLSFPGTLHHTLAADSLALSEIIKSKYLGYKVEKSAKIPYD